MTLDELVEVAREIYPDGYYPKPLNALVELHSVKSGAVKLDDLRSHQRKRVKVLRTTRDPIKAAFGVNLDKLEPKIHQRAAKGEAMIGQLILGTLAERAFEAIYRSKLGDSEFSLQDYREDRNDTDYRVCNGGGRPLFRINSKFHGSHFRQAREMVGLEPADCFALATYKIWSATQKEQDEHLPYLFLIISAPISTPTVVAHVPPAFRTLAKYMHASAVAAGKRDLEERMVEVLIEDTGAFGALVKNWQDEIASAQWRVLSARRAVKLLREKMFERVFALKTRNFNQAYRNAEIDMHYSLAGDMTPLQDVLEVLRNEGSQGVVGRAMTAVI